jgi:Tfp pilus assembly PilM family ATPase
MIRRIDTGCRQLLAAADDEFTLQELIAGIALEAQRSLDYYESHYDCRPITEVVLGPGAELGGLPDALAEQLGLTVSRLDFAELFRVENELTPEEQGDCFLAIGAALRSIAQEQPQAMAS